MDSGTGHSQPAVCMNCHGGNFSSDGSSVNNAHFLPFDFASLEFKNATDRAAAVNNINKLNQLVRNAEKSAYAETNPEKDPTLEGIDYSRLRIVDYINAEYGQAVGAGSETPFSEAVLKTPMKDNYIEPAFKGTTNNQVLYKTVTRNYCRTCHLAVDQELSPTDIPRHVCKISNMPQAEVNAKNALRHMNEIAAIVYQTTGNSDCFKMPQLEDFQWNAAESKSISTSPSLGLGNSDVFPISKDALNGFSAAFQAKRVLKLDKTSNHGFMVIEAPKLNGQYLRSITAISFLAPPLPTDQSLYIRADMFDAQGAKIGQVTSITGAGIPNFSVSTPLGSPFQKYTTNISALGIGAVNKVELHLKRNRSIGSELYNFSSPIEFEDVSVTYTVPLDLGQKVLAVEDFEDQTIGGATNLTLGNLSVRNTGIGGTSINGNCNAGRANKGFEISAVRKVGRDSGRYSFVSNPVFCAGETSILFVATQAASANNKGRTMSFDFVIDRQPDGKPVGHLDDGEFDVLEVAKNQGTVTETPEKFLGHVVLNVTLRNF